MTTPQLINMDFDGVRQSLRDYLASTGNYTDYNLEGSGISQLLNVLAYNTSMNGYLANATINEAFLDSAVKRGSAISRAKESGYTPRSATSAKALVNVIIQNPISSTSAITLEKNTPFYSNIGSTSYTFYNRESMTVFPINGQYTFFNVPLYEGNIVTNSYKVDTVNSISDTIFTIPNKNIDINSISVYVQNSGLNSTIAKWAVADDVSGLNSTSQIFFIQANSMENYDIYFGDGVIGKKLTVGNIVVVSYQICDTTDANTASTFSQTFTCNSIAGNTGLLINTVQNSMGGLEEESIDEIKFNAPLSVATNNRAIVETDYFSLISKYATSVKSVAVYGGEKSYPPVFGKVFISLEPFSGYYISDSVKTDIANNILKSRNMMTVTPEFLDPDYIFLTLDSSVQYDGSMTTLSAASITAIVQNTINNYVSTSIGKFRQPFYFSKLTLEIDISNISIVSNILKFSMQKRLFVAYGSPIYTTLNYSTKIKPYSVQSNSFTYYSNNDLVYGILADDGNGVLQIMDYTNKTIINSNIGSIDYSTGILKIVNMTINSLTGDQNQLKINCTPLESMMNIIPQNNQIIRIDDSSMSVSDNVIAGITISATPIGV